MIDFEPTETQRQFISTAREFGKEVLEPAELRKEVMETAEAVREVYMKKRKK